MARERRLGIAFGAVLFVLTSQPRSSPCAPNTESYKQNAQGLEKQFVHFLKAYQKGDDKGMDESFGVFRFPRPKEWFGNYFSADDAARLSSAYEGQLSDAESSLIQNMNLADPGSGFRVRCEPRGDTGAGQSRPEEDWVRPLKPIPVEQFRLEFRSASHDQKFSFIANFVYADGAYRFVGGGGVPFWSKPGATK